METQNIDHIGIAVENIEEAIKFYTEKLGMKVIHREVLEDRGLKVAFLTGKEGETAIELLEPINHEDMNNTVAKFIKNRGQGLHHLAIKVENIESSLKELESQGIQLVDKKPRPGARGHLVAFVHPKSVMGVLLELVQPRE
ncbi:methylmalonyl-CoA epimerase [Sulfurisphaera tokodaii]|uniref:Methylmalonyl-CoA epimerase n=2 Tax=Sulfurisphaera tokodaii TaxID=111955 RepID=Q974V7_SULTO|nr:methylmalonyl-CoA epimerase [Sulfurisphaera tokodaii]BAB65550.1 methylmalonyl-CoA epimerase [Sulfurisphaera tokodaii str. 7]HII74749.1 methylmalonyl-CoA epimerase [Sulfurisphaera tokodaii]